MKSGITQSNRSADSHVREFQHIRRGRPHLSALLLLCGGLCLSPAVRAQTNSINWSTIDGGGGTSTGGVYSVSGTIGQPDAGVMSNGNYSITGGFWGLLSVVQTPGSPLLAIVLTTTNTAVVYWPSPS